MRIRTLFVTAAVLVAGGGLGACQRGQPQVAALPLDTGAAQPLGEAPPPGGLPPAPPARIATLTDYRDAYAYPDRAWGMSWAFGDSPPDYAFYDDGVTPWVWVADDDSECLAEPVPGGERYYYFEPGAYTPFYVADPSFGYGFQNGQLVAIYARGGRQIAPGADPAAAATAGQYLARGRLLRQASTSQPHRPVAAANWNARRALIAAERTTFARDAARDPAWVDYHGQRQAQDQARFAAEAARRESWAAQTDTRLGEPARAQREQHAAQSIAQNGPPSVMRRGSPQSAAPGQSFAAAAPRTGAPAAAREAAPPAQFQRQAEVERQASAERQARAGRAPRSAVGAAPSSRFAQAPAQRPAERAAARPQAVAHAAVEHGADAAFQARAAAAGAERHAIQPTPHAAPQAAQAFHPPPVQPQAAHAAPPAHAAVQAQQPAAPQARPVQHGDDRGDKKQH